MNGELITVQVDGELFGIDVMAIREIRVWTPTTRLPHVPDYVAGIINLRGAVVPVLDLAACLGWKPIDATSRHAIIVTEIKGQARGLIVDAVSDIVIYPADSLEPAPTTCNDRVAPFLTGILPSEDKLIMVLNLDVFADLEIEAEAA